MQTKKLGILVGGGPAPGINSVISSITIEAIYYGFEVIGFLDGYRHMVKGDSSKYMKLGIDDISRITPTGGSFLGTSRTTPANSRAYLNKVLMVLQSLNITHLISIGGVSTAYATMKVTELAAEKGYHIKAVHIPKTIDNDFPLPEEIKTFGFESARAFGTKIISILAEDSRSTGRWYLSVVRGGETGHLTLGIGKSASATLTLIPEDFAGECSLRKVVDTIVGAVFKRKVLGKKYGIVVAAEGLIHLPGPSHLELNDILDWNSLLLKLKNPDIPVAHDIFKLLGPQNRESISNWESGKLLDLAAMHSIINEFNEISRKKDLSRYLADHIIKLQSGALKLLMNKKETESRGEEFPPEKLRKLNCLLIHSIFSREISPCHFLGSHLPRDIFGNPLHSKLDFTKVMKDEILERLTEFGFYALESEDILNWKDFLESLKKHDTEAKARLWDFLDEESRNLIDEWQLDKPFPEKSRTKLIASLNKVIDRPDFYDHFIFSKLELGDTAKMIIRKLRIQLTDEKQEIPGDYINRNLPVILSNNRMRMFNRLVLRAIFPNEIANIPKTRIVAKEIGYELRCTPPVSSDLDYTRNLGCAAINFLREDKVNGIIYIKENKYYDISFDEFFADASESEKIRRVDTESVFYRIAQEYMIKLDTVDFEDPVKLKKLAETAGITPERFREEFYHVVNVC